jgi:CheY-like chemotaxis protein
MGQQVCRRVLVVDDQLDVQETIAELLADGEFISVTANNGIEALQQLHAMDEKPCVILLDLKMPIMNGFEFRAAQRASGLDHIPVIVLTANFQCDEVCDLGAVGFVRKPFDSEMLLDVVTAASAGSGALSDEPWRRVAEVPERWERRGFGAVQERGPALWTTVPTCGHDYYAATDAAQARQQLDQYSGLCFACWYHARAACRAWQRGPTSPADSPIGISTAAPGRQP